MSARPPNCWSSPSNVDRVQSPGQQQAGVWKFPWEGKIWIWDTPTRLNYRKNCSNIRVSSHTHLLPGILMTSLMMSNITSRSREAKNKNLAIVLDGNTSREVWLAVMIDASSSNMIPRQLCVSVRTCVCASSMTLTPVTPVCRDKPPGWGSAGRQTSCPYSPLFFSWIQKSTSSAFISFYWPTFHDFNTWT